MANLLFIEPFYTGSHASWLEGLCKNTAHSTEMLTLPGRHWKWRMHGAAVSLADKFESVQQRPDLIVATDMMDLAVFRSLTATKTWNIPFAVYFHENQITYPWSATDPDRENHRDRHYGFINYTSALSADRLWFNSEYHLQSFLSELEPFLKVYPDFQEVGKIKEIEAKSEVLKLGVDLRSLNAFRSTKNAYEPPLILWNHRWEYGKNPEDFFEALISLQNQGLSFQLAVLGEQYGASPPIFELAKDRLSDSIVQFGPVDSREDYAHWLWRSDVLPVTSNQDFFGISTVEAMYCGCYPLLPNRLAFPEHLPNHLRDTHLYQGKMELVEKLAALLQNPGSTPDVTIRKKVGQYDWSNAIATYDRKFEEVIQHFKAT